jgi:transposase
LHLELLDAEMMQIVEYSREGKILTSTPGIGLLQAVIFIALIGNIANFDRPAQLKSYCGWVPAIAQSGTSLDRSRLSPRGAHLLKPTISS